MRIDQQLKEQLAREIRAIIADWTLEEAMNAIHLRPSRISELRHGKLSSLSIARLLQAIARMGYDVEISLRVRKPPPREFAKPKLTVMRYDRFDRPETSTTER